MSQTAVKQLMAAMPYATHLGITLDSASPDEVVGHLDWTVDLCTADGLLHWGALMSLADTIGAVCAFLCLPDGANTATSSSTTHLVRAVRDGSVTAIASPLHRGRSNIVVQTNLTDGQGRLVAQTTQTQAVLT